MISELKSHPKGLKILFLTEMWERFSFYGMRALLVLYLVNSLEMPRATALEIYATYTGLVYLSAVVGGYLADKWLGTRRSVLIGGIVMALGHFAMAFPSLLYAALGLLIVGNGFFKPNISTTVGSLYEKNDARRDGGFTIFYMGINLGAFFSPLICGTLGEKLGWHYGFAAAGIGMLIGLLIFVMGQKLITPVVNINQADKHSSAANQWSSVFLISISCVALVFFCVYSWQWISPIWNNLGALGKIITALFIIALFGFTPRLISALSHQKNSAASHPPLTKEEIHRVIAIFIMGVFIIFFWMGFEQAGGTMNLFADKQTDRMLGDWEIPASYFQSINPLVIILLAPVFAVFWLRLDNSRYAISPIAKQAIGMIILGLGFVVLAYAQGQAELVGKVGPLWLVVVYILFTLGELCLSPIGLSMVTKLAPLHMVSFLMGIWFTAMAAANYLAGKLESLLQGSDVPLYWFLVASSIGAGLVLLAITPLMKKLMHGVH